MLARSSATNTYYARCGDPVRCTKPITYGCTSGNSARSSNLIPRRPVTVSLSRQSATACGWRTSRHHEIQPWSVAARQVNADLTLGGACGVVDCSELTYDRGCPKRSVT